MTSAESTPFPRLDFDARYRGESPAEGLPPVQTPPWDTKALQETNASQLAFWIVRAQRRG